MVSIYHPLCLNLGVPCAVFAYAQIDLSGTDRPNCLPTPSIRFHQPLAFKIVIRHLEDEFVVNLRIIFTWGNSSWSFCKR